MIQVVATPAGPLELACRIEGLSLVRVEARELSRGVVERWTSAGVVDVTFVRAELEPPPFGTGPPVDFLLGVVWTVAAERSCGPLTFEASLTDPEAQQHLDPNNGEALEAVSYERPGLALSIGTQDDAWLEARTNNVGPTRTGPSLPPTWASALAQPAQRDYGARCVPSGLVIRLPPLTAGQRADIHVAVAWAFDRDDSATWFAVDTDPAQILSAALSSPR